MPFNLAHLPPRPRKGDQLFRFGNSRVQSRDERLLDTSPTAYTFGYRLAAERLVKCAIEEKREGDFLAYPIVFLYRHHLELALKRIIYCVPRVLKRELTEREKKSLGDHKLDALWNDLEPVFTKICEAVNWQPPEAEDLDGARSYLRQLSSVDPSSMNFRYWRSKEGAPSLSGRLEALDIQHFSKMMSRLADFISGLDAATIAAGEMLDEIDIEFGEIRE